ERELAMDVRQLAFDAAETPPEEEDVEDHDGPDERVRAVQERRRRQFLVRHLIGRHKSLLLGLCEDRRRDAEERDSERDDRPEPIHVSPPMPDRPLRAEPRRARVGLGSRAARRRDRKTQRGTTGLGSASRPAASAARSSTDASSATNSPTSRRTAPA